jgi:hypothetical protein
MKRLTSQRANLEFLQLNTSAAHGGSLCKDAGATLRMTSQNKLT